MSDLPDDMLWLCVPDKNPDPAYKHTGGSLKPAGFTLSDYNNIKESVELWRDKFLIVQHDKNELLDALTYARDQFPVSGSDHTRNVNLTLSEIIDRYK